MESFARETRHREHQLQDFDAIDQVARKFLATQCPKFADWKRVYPWVSDDLSAIEFRAPGVLQDYANYRCADPKELARLLGDEANLKEAQKMPIFRDYCCQVKPPKGKEVLVFFLHGQKTKNLAEHLEGFPERNRLLDDIRAYQAPKGMDAAEQIGNFLANLKVRAPEYVETSAPEAPQKKKSTTETSPREVSVVLKTPEPSAWKDTDHWENPVLKAFKISQQLPTVFPTHKCVKQMIVGSAAPSFALGKENLGKSQPPRGAARLEGAPYGPLISAYIESLPSARIEEIVGHPAAQGFYHALREKPRDNRHWVSLMIQAHADPTCIETHKKHTIEGELDHELVKLLL